MPRLRLDGRHLLFASFASLFSGAVTSLAFPPIAVWPVAFVSLIPFLWVVREAAPRRGALLGLVWGLGFFGPTLYWIALFGQMAWVVLVFGQAAFVAVFGALARAAWRSEHPIASAFALSALWSVVEWGRGAFPFGGFAWGQLGISQVQNRALLPLASVTGVWGVTFVVVAVNGVLLLACTRRRVPSRAAVTAGMGVALVVWPLLLPATVASGPALRVAAIQVDVRPFRVLPSTAEDQAVTLAIAALHRRLAEHPPDLAVWGESAIDPGSTEPAFFADHVTTVIADVGARTLAGSIQPGRRGLENQVLAFDGHGSVVDRYAKVHLVPYGEFVPFRNELSWIGALRQIPYDLTPGEGIHALSIPGLPTFGTPICFENSFGSIDREMVNQGAGFLVVLTNNASYELTATSRQHLQMSQMRAVEDGRWVVHSAVSGISAFIDPRGRVVSRTGLFAPGILAHTIRSSSELTWYVRLGDWFPRACIVGLAGFLLLPRRRRRDHGTPSALPADLRTLVILPTYDERDTIEWVLEQILRQPVAVDVLVVDDSSPDGTGDLARSFEQRDDRVHVLERPAKSGLASAYLDGFRLALARGYDLIVEMDSDLSHDPEQLPGLLAAASRHDLTVGSRYVPGGSVTNWSRSRVALSRGGNLYARLMLGIPTRDGTSGYRVYRRDLLAELVAQPFHSDGYGFQIELVYRSWRLGYDVGEAPITFREREHGVSKISRRIVVEALWLVTVWGVKARLGLDRGHR